VEIVVVPTVRDPDGLALSSRNVYLDADERRRATALGASLDAARGLIASGVRDTAKIFDAMREIISARGPADIDYLSVADPVTMEEVSSLRPGSTVLVSLAVKIGKTRLIDNDLFVVG
jgi:pantoate--beta-alanine ligase